MSGFCIRDNDLPDGVEKYAETKEELHIKPLDASHNESHFEVHAQKKASQ
jgi:hypothetical protein